MNPELYQQFIKGEITSDELLALLTIDKNKKVRAHLAVKKKKYDPYFTLDNKVYIHKYYPWCYENYKPSLVLQGWYSEENAKKAYLKVYGPKSLNYVKFIRGKEAIERGFLITYHLYINGKWRYICGKHTMYHCSGDRLRLQTKVKLVDNAKGANGHLKRHSLENEILYFNNGSNGEVILKDTTNKKVRLQATQAANNRRKKDLYEE